VKIRLLKPHNFQRRDGCLNERVGIGYNTRHGGDTLEVERMITSYDVQPSQAYLYFRLSKSHKCFAFAILPVVVVFEAIAMTETWYLFRYEQSSNIIPMNLYTVLNSAKHWSHLCSIILYMEKSRSNTREQAVTDR
jgi:hypothetical protein